MLLLAACVCMGVGAPARADLVLANHPEEAEPTFEDGKTPSATAEAPKIQEPKVLKADERGPEVFRGPVGGAVGHGLRPVYRVAEGAADKLYNLIRRGIFGTLLPTDLSRNLERPPDVDSYAEFQKALARRQDQYAVRVRETYPWVSFADQTNTAERDGRMEAWRSWAMEEQRAVLGSAFQDALLARYGLDRFGQRSEDYASDRRNWDPGFLAAAGLLTGTFAYVNGIHGVGYAGPARVHVNMRAGYLLRRAFASSGRDYLGDLQIGYKNSPVTLGLAWAVDRGRVVRDAYGVRYEKRF